MYAECLCLEGESEIFFEILDPRELDSFSGSESVLDDGRSDKSSFHIDIDTKLEKSLLDLERPFLDLEWRDFSLIADMFEMLDRWVGPLSKLWHQCSLL